MDEDELDDELEEDELDEDDVPPAELEGTLEVPGATLEVPGSTLLLDGSSEEVSAVVEEFAKAQPDRSSDNTADDRSKAFFIFFTEP